MNKINYSLLKNKIKSSNLDNFYCFYGENDFLIDKFTRIVIEKTIGNENNPFNFMKFDEDLDFGELSLAINSLPVCQHKKVVLVRNFRLKNLKIFSEYVKDLPDFVTLILLINREENKDQVEKDINSSIESGTLVEFPRIKNLKILEKQIIVWGREFNKDISSEDAQLLIEKCGTNMDFLYNNLQKICLGNSEIIEKTINPKFEKDNVFNINKYIINKDFDKLFLSLNTLSKEELFSTINIIGSVFVSAYRLKIAQRYNLSIDDVSKDFGFENKKFILKNIEKDFKNINEITIKKCIEIIVETDSLIKTCDLSIIYLIEKMVFDIISAIA
ncbi:MAG: DNA polymerase III subunit delta [Candidatus Improbicoccus pseudotrichonymphae]|uniref:DNA polymerase III subunit delta n=1 Tax=Candidatus Improbicoccus pseudotrichonymphae TaxID=3033792 RepID=A0AA48I1I5_9FIRM|nr:MAG: DNA polymerase III subunit delta [Candidatus Improbicoccus pseudotrichonymphae]